MESAMHFSEEWSSLSGAYTAEEADFMNQFLGNCQVPEQFYEPANTNFLQVSSSINCTNNPVTTTCADKNLQTHKECEILVTEPEEDKTRSLEKPRKRSRTSNEVPKNNRNVKSKKNRRSASISAEEDRSSCPQDQTCCSDDESNNASQEERGGASSSLSLNDSSAIKLSSKSTSSRGTATDPQSVYARRRRERINERLRILQKLVPNGTKVDISTMLDEAVQYVKFLQIQIKLLSSDDLWMYAPIAYNGMNIGL